MNETAATTNRIAAAFARSKESGRGTLLPFICAGYPTPGLLGRLLPAIESAGASIVEIGIPFSDPIADGPVIAAAMHEALGQGATPAGIFDEVRAARDSTSMGLVAMVSYSIVNRLGGPNGFCEQAASAGFDGLIVPDCPIDEAGDLKAACDERGLTLTHLIAPTTSKERAIEIAQQSSGFVYLLARAGLTGERDEAPEVKGRVSVLREFTDLPIACGFGISTPGHVREVVTHADGAIVGSALVRRMGEPGIDPVDAAAGFVSELATGLAGNQQV